jgi:hypothetical protein
MPRPTVAEAQGREAIFHDAPPVDPVTAPPTPAEPEEMTAWAPARPERPRREERIARKTYHLPRDLIQQVADAAGPELTQSQIVAAALRRYLRPVAPAGPVGEVTPRPEQLRGT